MTSTRTEAFRGSSGGRTRSVALAALGQVLACLIGCSQAPAPESPGAKGEVRGSGVSGGDSSRQGASSTPDRASVPALRTVTLSPDSVSARAKIEKTVRTVAETLKADGRLIVDLEGFASMKTPVALSRALGHLYASNTRDRLVLMGVDRARVHVRSALGAEGEEPAIKKAEKASSEPRVVISFRSATPPAGAAPRQSGAGEPKGSGLAGADKITPPPGGADAPGQDGYGHSERVQAFGRFLANCEKTADVEVVDYYAYLHEAFREPETSRLGTEVWVATLERELNAGVLRLTGDQMESLFRAFAAMPGDAESGKPDKTVDVCYDACFLDASRPEVDLPVASDWLRTSTARRADVIYWARRTNHGEAVPDPPEDERKAKRTPARWTTKPD